MKQVNILMMGGKRCGKTTVLASMYGEINKALAELHQSGELSKLSQQFFGTDISKK